MKIVILVILVILASGCAVLENNPALLKPVDTQNAPENPPVITREIVEAIPTLTTPNPTATQANKSNLEDFGPAPEIKNDVWLNVGGPLRLAELGGKVVLLEMWTFG
jgi:hypothetical protein